MAPPIPGSPDTQVAQLVAAFHDDGPRAWLCGPATPSGLRRKGCHWPRSDPGGDRGGEVGLTLRPPSTEVKYLVRDFGWAHSLCFHLTCPFDMSETPWLQVKCGRDLRRYQLRTPRLPSTLGDGPRPANRFASACASCVAAPDAEQRGHRLQGVRQPDQRGKIRPTQDTIDWLAARLGTVRTRERRLLPTSAAASRRRSHARTRHAAYRTNEALQEYAWSRAWCADRVCRA